MESGDKMARPSKSASVIKSEGKSHRTKAEILQREQAEKSALTGFPMRENADVAENEISHSEFIRVQELLSAVGKNDALYESVINDYCMYKSDISRYIKMRNEIENDEDIKGVDRYRIIVDCDKQIQSFQKKRFDIEKENGFTIASAMRSIPKKTESGENPLLKALMSDDDS